MNAWSFQNAIFHYNRNVRNVRNFPVFFYGRIVLEFI